MCSNIVLVVFMIGMIAGAGVCIVGLATPGWFGIVPDASKPYDIQWNSLWSCFQTSGNHCEDVWTNASDWLKATIALTIVGILAAGVALVWSCFLCFTCCCNGCLGPPLPILATLAFACQLSACIIYGVKIHAIDFKAATHDPIQELGWSFILVIVGTVVYFVDIILGGLIVACG